MGRRPVRLGLGVAAAVAAAVAVGLLTAPYGGTKWSTADGDAGPAISEQEQQPPLVSAAALAGRTVHDADGTDAGRLVSLLADTRTGRIRFAVVDRRSGSDPSRDEEVELPGAMLRLPAAPDGPMQLRAAGTTTSPGAAPASGSDAVERELEKADTRRQALAPLLDLRGAAVRTPSGETLGKIEDIVLDGSPEPRIAYVTVARDLGGQQTSAIVLPFVACAWRPAESSVLVVADGGSLKAAPVVPADRSAAPLDSTNVATLRRAFGF